MATMDRKTWLVVFDHLAHEIGWDGGLYLSDLSGPRPSHFENLRRWVGSRHLLKVVVLGHHWRAEIDGGGGDQGRRSASRSAGCRRSDSR